MAIFGSLSAVLAQLPQDARYSSARAYLATLVEPGSTVRRRLEARAVGTSEKLPLEGGVTAIEQVYLTKPRAECFYESHRKFIDIQFVLEGVEAMDVEDIGRLTVTQPFIAERDLIKYADAAPAAHLLVRAGEAAVYFPEDGHMPALQAEGKPVLIRKAVLKVPVA